MKRIALLLCLCAVALGGVAARAATQAPATPAHPPGPPTKTGPLENGPAVPAAPFLTGPPAARVLNDPHWSANVRANTDTTGPQFAQQEPSIGVNPLNHNNIVAAQKDERRAPGPNTATKETWIDTSTDGGLTWPVNVFIPMPDTSLPQQSDPVVTFSDNNNVFVTIIGLSDSGGIGTNTVMVARSSDGGLTWPTPAVRVDPGLGGSDKEWTTIDLNPASPHYHRLYVTWTNFAAGPQFVEKWSDDNGATWNPTPGTAFVTVSFGSFDQGQFSMPVVLPNGNVIATWNPGGVIAVGKSTDGGQSFINPNTAAVGITNVNSVPGSNWRLNTIPSTAASATGTLVTVWADGRNGKDDIYFTRSIDGGSTWSAAARVAHNPAGSSYQVEPWVAVAPNGRFDVIWYDDRNFPSNLNTFDIYASHSTDDGATWSGPDEQVTDAATNLNIGIPGGSGWNGAAGDYINVTSVNDAAYGVWTDTRSGTNEDVYVSRYTPPSQGTPTPTPTGTLATATQTRTPTITASPTATVNPCLLQNYVIATATGATLVPGTVDTGNHTDDGSTPITLPFPFTLYGQVFNTANVVSNGHLDFTTPDTTFTNTCLPDASASNAIFPYWDDLCTGPCATSTCTGCGVFTSVSGSAPNRILNIEWRANYYNTNTALGFEIRLYEGTSGQFDVIYGTVPSGNSSATVGVQKDTGSLFTQYACDGVGGAVAAGTLLSFSLPSCNTATPTPVPPTATATSTATVAISTATVTRTTIPVTGTATGTAAPPTATGTGVAATTTAAPSVTNTAIAATSTRVPPTGTAVPPTTTGTPCTISFTDVNTPDYFYVPVQYLYCHGVISGYSDNTFRPYNNTTRSQMVKIVVLGFNKAIQTPSGGGYTFTDVPPANPFFSVIETAAALNIVSGYNCGGPGEPCDANNRPYFRPFANVTRGQLSKIDVVAAAWALQNPANGTFTDVLPNTAFYEFVETAACHGIISGYNCGGPGEPCDANNRPYFRQNNDATRGQISKIVYLSITAGGVCSAP